MIKIAVVDDEEYSAIKCRRIIDSIGIKDLQVDIFIDSKHFCDVIFNHKEPFDIIILDIDMPGITGFDVARQIRNEYPDAIIMFYTAHDQYVFKSFEFQPFRYIRKIAAEEELPFSLKCAIDKLKVYDEKSVIIKHNDMEVRVNYKKIMLVEKSKSYSKNYIDIYTNDGICYNTKKTLSEFFYLLSDSIFIYVRKGSIVNMSYIKAISPDNIVLKDERLVPISRRNYKLVKAAFADYIGDII